MPTTTEILVVGDSDAELISRALAEENQAVRVEFVSDGETALEFLSGKGRYSSRSPKSPPKLVLLGLKLPKLSALEVLQQVKQDPSTSLIPVVVFTSSQEEKHLIACYQSGANSYVQKPTDFGQFRERIKAISRYWLQVNTTAAPGV